MAESSGERKVGQWLVSGEIGRGSFASVWKAQHEGTGNEVAIKEICTDKLNSRLRQSLESEVAILKRIDHKNIVHLKEVIAVSIQQALTLSWFPTRQVSPASLPAHVSL